MRKTFVLVALCFATVALGQSQSPAPPPPPSQSQPQQKPDSLAEAARKAKAEKGKAKTGKVYTDEDLSELKSGGVSVVGQEGASAEAKDPEAAPEANDPAASGKKGEEYWRGKARKLRDQMAAVDQEIVKTKDEIKKYGNVGFDVNTGLKQDIIYVADRNTRLQKLEKRKEELQKQMEALQEDGRRAGASPSWFR